MNDLLTLKEVADILKCGQVSVRRLISNGLLTAVDITARPVTGSKPRLRVSRVDLESFLNRKRVVPRPHRVRRRRTKCETST